MQFYILTLTTLNNEKKATSQIPVLNVYLYFFKIHIPLLIFPYIPFNIK